MLDSIAEYACLDCSEISRLVGLGKVQSVTVRERAVEALRSIQQYNAVAEVYEMPAMPVRKGILSGVPILHKDGGAQVIGLPREYGSKLGSGQVCSTTSQFWDVLLDAGCDIVGRSRVPELHMSVLGDNAIEGSTLNPWDPALSMGGSTSGVTALALGAVPVVHGGDSGGSLRVPCSWTGCYTMKPARNWVSASPGGTELLGLNEIFVATRSLRDIRRFSALLSASALDDYRPAVGSKDHWSVRRGRIMLCDSFYPDHPVDPDISAALQAFGDFAANLGFEVNRVSLNLDFDAVCDALYTIACVDLSLMVSSLTTSGSEDVRERCQPYISRWFEEGKGLPAESVIRAVDTASRVGRILSRELNRYDFLITPVTAQRAPAMDTVHSIGEIHGSRALNEAFEEIVHFCVGPNMSGHPALVLPFSQSSGLSFPCGIQIIGQPYDHSGLIDFAELFDEGFAPPPGFLGNDFLGEHYDSSFLLR